MAKGNEPERIEKNNTGHGKHERNLSLMLFSIIHFKVVGDESDPNQSKTVNLKI